MSEVTISKTGNNVKVTYPVNGATVVIKSNDLTTPIENRKPIPETFAIDDDGPIAEYTERISAAQQFYTVASTPTASLNIVEDVVPWSNNGAEVKTDGNKVSFSKIPYADSATGVNFNIPQQIQSAGLDVLIVKITGKDFAHIKVEGSKSLNDIGDYIPLKMTPLRDSNNELWSSVVTDYSSGEEYYSISIKDLKRLQIVGMFADSEIELFAVSKVGDLNMPAQIAVPVSFSKATSAIFGQAPNLNINVSGHNNVNIKGNFKASTGMKGLNSAFFLGEDFAVADPRDKNYQYVTMKVKGSFIPTSKDKIVVFFNAWGNGGQKSQTLSFHSIVDSKGNIVTTNKPTAEFSSELGLDPNELYTVTMKLPTKEEFPERLALLQFVVHSYGLTGAGASVDASFGDIKLLKRELISKSKLLIDGDLYEFDTGSVSNSTKVQAWIEFINGDVVLKSQIFRDRSMLNLSNGSMERSGRDYNYSQPGVPNDPEQLSVYISKMQGIKSQLVSIRDAGWDNPAMDKQELDVAVTYLENMIIELQK